MPSSYAMLLIVSILKLNTGIFAARDDKMFCPMAYEGRRSIFVFKLLFVHIFAKASIITYNPCFLKMVFGKAKNLQPYNCCGKMGVRPLFLYYYKKRILWRKNSYCFDKCNLPESQDKAFCFIISPDKNWINAIKRRATE